MSEEKYGVVCELPLTCGTCGHVGHWTYLRWCGACNEAICPTCFPASEEKNYPHRCSKCLKSNRTLRLVLAGMEARRKEEERVLAAILG